MEKYFCLYTHQKTKKRKTWYDGQVIINSLHSKCVLYSRDASEKGHKALDTKFLSKDQIQQIVTQSADELEFDNYLVRIEFSNDAYEAPALVKETQISKFTVPSNISKFTVPSMLSRPMPKNQCVSDASLPMRDVYTVTDKELDEIWAVGSIRQKCYENQQEYTASIAEMTLENEVIVIIV